MRASDTNATPNSPRAARGATAASQRPSPPSATRRPRPSLTDTTRPPPVRRGLSAPVPRTRGPAAPKRRRREAGLLSGSTAVGVVRLDDLLHELVTHDVFFVELDE